MPYCLLQRHSAPLSPLYPASNQAWMIGRLLVIFIEHARIRQSQEPIKTKSIRLGGLLQQSQAEGDDASDDCVNLCLQREASSDVRQRDRAVLVISINDTRVKTFEAMIRAQGSSGREALSSIRGDSSRMAEGYLCLLSDLLEGFSMHDQVIEVLQSCCFASREVQPDA